METDYRKEKIQTNVQIICVALIILEIYVIISSIFGGVNFQLGVRGIDSVSIFSKPIKSIFLSIPNLLLHTIPSIIFGVAIIYFSVGTYKLNEKARYILSILLLVKIIFLAGVYVLMVGFTIITYLSNSHFIPFDIMFIFMFLLLGMIVLAFSLVYFLSRRYLNKLETVSLFTPVQNG